jgi:hypothetical protein
MGVWMVAELVLWEDNRFVAEGRGDDEDDRVGGERIGDHAKE